MPETHEFDWLVVFIMYANLSDEHNNKLKVPLNIQLETHINQIRDSVFSEKVKVIILLNKIELIADNIKKVKEIKEKTTSGLETLISKVETIDSFQDEDALTNDLNCIKIKFPSKKVMINTWDHGSIFGIFTFLVKSKKSIKDLFAEDKLSYSFTNKVFYETGFNFSEEVGSISILESKIPIGSEYLLILTNKELNYVFKNSFGKIDILLMFNCVMQNVFTQTELKDTVNYLIAPQTGIAFPGFNYLGILNYLALNSFVSSKNLSVECINSVRANPLCLGLGNKENSDEVESSWSIQVIDLTDYDSFLKLLLSLINYLIIEARNNSTIKAKIIDSFKNSFSYDSDSLKIFVLKDLNTFLDRLRGKFLSYINIVNNIDSVISDIQKRRVSLFTSNSLNNLIEKIKETSGQSGFSIFYPEVDYKVDEIRKIFLKKNIYTPLFFTITKWNDLLSIVRDDLNFMATKNF
jgi:hypothetical protein